MNKFSIIMPFYNSQEYIRRAILSIINQTYENWELIAVNDGSTDRSLEIINKYVLTDKRIKVISKENGGYATAVNCGLDNLSPDSDYFLFLGSDDELFVDLFKKIDDKLKDYQFDIVGFKTLKTDETGNSFWEKFTNINKKIEEKNINIFSFYEKYPDIPELFVIRDTSRVYRTSKLGDLRYFGNYGISADGIFSFLFAQKCTSFAQYPIEGYKWHFRSQSVSNLKLTDKKLEDKFRNWFNFFSVVLANNYKLTKFSQTYIEKFISAYFAIIYNENDNLFNNNKSYIVKSSKLIKQLIKSYEFSVPKKRLFLVKHPFICRAKVKIRKNYF